jgi:hypothetical protein
VSDINASSSNPVYVSEAQFWLCDAGTESTPEVAQHTNGILDRQAPGAARVHTGANTGDVLVTVDTRDNPPPAPELDSWEEIVEISLEVPAGELRIYEIDDNSLGGLPVMTPSGPGSYRIRISARGRDIDYDGVAEDLNEQYHIITWLAPAEPEIIYKTTDECGASFRHAVNAPRSETPPTTGGTHQFRPMG